MTGLPLSWQWVRLGEVARIQGGIQKQGKRRPVKNKYPFLRVANVQRGRLELDEVHEVELFDGELDRYKLQAGDLLVVEGNGSPDQIGRAAVWDGSIDNCVHQNHLIRVRPSRRLLPKYLELAWNAPGAARRLRQVAASTSGLYTLNIAKVGAVQIPICPVEEQRRIVDILEDHFSRLDAAGFNLSSACLRAERWFAAELQWLWDEAKSISLLTPVASLGKVTTGNTPSTRHPELFGGVVPFLTPSDIGHGGQVTSWSRTLSDKGAVRARVVGPNAVVAVCIGATLGKIGWVDQPVSGNQQINFVCLDPALASAEFTAVAMASPPFQRQMLNEASSTTMPILNKSRFSQLRLPLPDVLSQHRLISRLQQAMIARERVADTLADLERRSTALRRSLLMAAFAGQLTRHVTDTDFVEEIVGV